jgi:hypothetical protein
VLCGESAGLLKATWQFKSKGANSLLFFLPTSSATAFGNTPCYFRSSDSACFLSALLEVNDDEPKLFVIVVDTGATPDDLFKLGHLPDALIRRN